MADWISVADERPPINEAVLAVVFGYPKQNIELVGSYEFVTLCEDGGWIVEAYPEWEGAIVTHWMSLPEPPGEEAHK